MNELLAKVGLDQVGCFVLEEVGDVCYEGQAQADEVLGWTTRITMVGFRAQSQVFSMNWTTVGRWVLTLSLAGGRSCMAWTKQVQLSTRHSLSCSPQSWLSWDQEGPWRDTAPTKPRLQTLTTSSMQFWKVWGQLRAMSPRQLNTASFRVLSMVQRLMQFRRAGMTSARQCSNQAGQERQMSPRVPRLLLNRSMSLTLDRPCLMQEQELGSRGTNCSSMTVARADMTQSPSECTSLTAQKSQMMRSQMAQHSSILILVYLVTLQWRHAYTPLFTFYCYGPCTCPAFLNRSIRMAKYYLQKSSLSMLWRMFMMARQETSMMVRSQGETLRWVFWKRDLTMLSRCCSNIGWWGWRWQSQGYSSAKRLKTQQTFLLMETLRGRLLSRQTMMEWRSGWLSIVRGNNSATLDRVELAAQANMSSWAIRLQQICDSPLSIIPFSCSLFCPSIMAPNAIIAALLRFQSGYEMVFQMNTVNTQVTLSSLISIIEHKQFSLASPSPLSSSSQTSLVRFLSSLGTTSMAKRSVSCSLYDFLASSSWAIVLKNSTEMTDSSRSSSSRYFWTSAVSSNRNQSRCWTQRRANSTRHCRDRTRILNMLLLRQNMSCCIIQTLISGVSRWLAMNQRESCRALTPIQRISSLVYSARMLTRMPAMIYLTMSWSRLADLSFRFSQMKPRVITAAFFMSSLWLLVQATRIEMMLGHSLRGSSMPQILAMTSAVALLAMRSGVTNVQRSMSLIWFFCCSLSLSQMGAVEDMVRTRLMRVPLA